MTSTTFGRWFLGALLGLTALPSAAGTVHGIGSRDCEAFMRAVEIQSNEAIDAYISWAQGYLSGFNATNDRRADIRIDHGSLTYWLIGHCGGSRQTKFFEAVQTLVSQQAGR